METYKIIQLDNGDILLQKFIIDNIINTSKFISDKKYLLDLDNKINIKYDIGDHILLKKNKNEWINTTFEFIDLENKSLYFKSINKEEYYKILFTYINPSFSISVFFVFCMYVSF